MGTRLHENLTSAYFEAANKLNSKKAGRKIVAYVESYDDVFFWRQILSRFETDNVYFEVMLPSRTQKLERGKKAALMSLLSDHVGQGMIACIDADYDYLMQGATHVSREVTTNPYIFHAYAYAIENMMCYAPSLHDVCVAVTLNDHAIFDMERYLADFSEAIFPLFVWSVWHYRTARHNRFTITDFLKIIELGSFSFRNADACIENLRRKAHRKTEVLHQLNPGARESYMRVWRDLEALGVTPSTTYMYIQGHHLFDKVVVPMLTKICEKLVRERENEIERTSLHSTQRRNELTCYANSMEEIIPMLKKNSGYMRSEQFLKIMADLEELMRTVSEDTLSHAST